MTDSKTYAATPAATLEQHVMDSRIPKSEAGWWARREIERLRAKIDAMNAAAESLKGVCACRFDAEDTPIKECTLHAEMRAENAKLRATLFLSLATDAPLGDEGPEPPFWGAVKVNDNLRAEVISLTAQCESYRESFAGAVKVNDNLRAALGNLICRINRDGGHAMTDDLFADAAAADLVAADLNAEGDRLRAENAALREALSQFDKRAPSSPPVPGETWWQRCQIVPRRTPDDWSQE